MVLAVDVGNSNTTVGLFDEAGELKFRSTLETFRGKTQDQCAIDLLGVLGLYGADVRSVDGTILSSVVPAADRSVHQCLGPAHREPSHGGGPRHQNGLEYPG